MYINLKPCLTVNINNIDLANIKEFDEEGNSCFVWNDSVYYPKSTNLNELIGEELAKEINLRTVHFRLFEDTNGIVIIASKSFINPNSKYLMHHPCGYYNISELEKIRTKCIDDENYERLLNNIFKMFAIDIYMGQSDRCYENFRFEKYDTGYLDLAPLYDYSDSSWDEDLCYDNPLYCFEKEEDYDLLFSTYPTSLQIMKAVQKINLSKVLHRIELSKDIKFPQVVTDIYLRREELAQKKLEKIIN